MDLKGWDGPVVGVLGTLLAAVLTLVGVRARQNHKRTQSQDDLAETENTVGAIYVNQILADNERLKKERDEAMQQAHVNYQLYVVEQRRADLAALELKQHAFQLERLNEQVSELTRSVLKYRPEEKKALTKSGFGELDPLLRPHLPNPKDH